MQFTATKIPGVYIVDVKTFEDERGYYVDFFEIRKFTEMGLPTHVAQVSMSYNVKAGTLRGLHYQLPPHAQAKLCRCSRGALFDVAVDIRPDSPTYRQWIGVELSAENRRMLVVPAGMAHGFQTLEDHTELVYQIGDIYAPELYRGYRYDDPAFQIAWPRPVSAIAPRDNTYEPFTG